MKKYFGLYNIQVIKYLKKSKYKGIPDQKVYNNAVDYFVRLKKNHLTKNKGKI